MAWGGRHCQQGARRRGTRQRPGAPAARDAGGELRPAAGQSLRVRKTAARAPATRGGLRDDLTHRQRRRPRARARFFGAAPLALLRTDFLATFLPAALRLAAPGFRAAFFLAFFAGFFAGLPARAGFG